MRRLLRSRRKDFEQIENVRSRQFQYTTGRKESDYHVDAPCRSINGNFEEVGERSDLFGTSVNHDELNYNRYVEKMIVFDVLTMTDFIFLFDAAFFKRNYMKKKIMLWL